MFKKISLVIGMPVTAVLLVGIIALVLRVTYVQFSSPAVDEPHYAAKQRYLDQVTSASDKRPNVVIIFFDDLGYGDLSSYGNSFIQTPHIDGLADEGMRMTQFYSASPVCTPSRAALLTGRFPPRTRTDRHVFFNDDHILGLSRRVIGLPNELPREEITLAEVLQRVGYQTKLVGKWHLGTREDYRPTNFGFDHWYGVLYSNDMYPLHLFEDDEIVIEDKRQGGMFSSERDELNPLQGEGIDQTELTQLFTNNAIAFLEQQDDEPFLLYLAHTSPHVPHYASKEFAGTSTAGTYGDVIEDLDRSTGQILAKIDELGLRDNTLVIVTSDNGADYNGSAGHLRGRKSEILEGGQRVPMIVRWPGKIDAGNISHEMAMNTDLMPTLLDVLQVSPPTDRIIDGKSIMQTLSGGGSAHNNLYYFPTLATAPGAIRDKDLKLTWATGDRGRDRAHLSRMTETEQHEVSNLFPDEFERLKIQLSNMREEVLANPRGWVELEGE